MKSKGLIFVSCLAAGALMASPAMGKPAKKSTVSKSRRVAPQTTHVTRNYNQNISPRMGSTRSYSGTRYTGTRSYSGTRYSGTRSYANRQYSGTRYYGRNGYYGNNYYGGGTRVYYDGGGSTRIMVIPGYAVLQLGIRHIGILPVFILRQLSVWGSTRITGVIPTAVTTITTTATTTTGIIRRPTAIMDRWSQRCSGALANSVTTTA